LLNELVVLLAVAVLSLYIRVSAGQFVLVLAPALAFELVHDLAARTLIRRLAQPVESWLSGARGGENAGLVWQRAASLPRELVLRDATPRYPLGVVVWTFIPAWCAYFTWRLSLPAYQ